MADGAAPTPSIEDGEVMGMYREAAGVANRVMEKIAAKAVEGADVRGLCIEGDALILEETSTMLKKKVKGKALPKGIAFPTCISVNNCVCHFSPLETDPSFALAKGDLVKIDLGVHLDGYAAFSATTLVVGASAAEPVTGRKADVALGAYYAAELAARHFKAGAKTEDVAKVIADVGKVFNVVPLQDMQSFQLTKNTVTEGKSIVQNPSDGVKKDVKNETMADFEVYALDVYMSTGEGKGRPKDTRTTLHRCTGDSYQLKLKASRNFYGEVSKNFTSYPFSLRNCEDEKSARLGVKECVTHGLLEPYPVLYERDGEFVAQFRMLLLIKPNGTVKATKAPFDPAAFKSEHAITDEAMLALLKTGLSGAKKKNKKKAAAPAAATEAAN